MPQISIIVPVYNRAKVLNSTLKAIQAQTFRDWECLLVDDASTDDSWNVLLTFAASDARFVPLKNERQKGACGARNTGISHAKSPILHFFDSDDRMHENLLGELFAGLSDQVDVVTCWTNVINVDSNKIIQKFEHITEGNIHKELLNGKTYVDTNCALIRRDVVDKIGGWSEDCPSFQEWDFHLRLSKVAKYTTLHSHLIDYYVGGNDTISKSLPRAIRGMLYILDKYRGEFLKQALVSYMKQNFATFCRIRLLKGSGEKELSEDFEKKYHKITPFWVASLVKLLYGVRGVKKAVLPRIANVK